MRKSVIIILFVLFSVEILAQQSTSVIPPSPDAAALAVYGNIPVSTYTGVPNISIPIHTISYRDIQIPMDLTYHAAGITVEQDASWVGLGWALNVGGVITRTVKGGDDMQFSDDGYSNLGGGPIGYKGYPYDPFDNTANFLSNVCKKDIDAEPDIFYFNFLGKSGSFVLDKGQNLAANELVGTVLKVEKIDIKYDKTNKTWIIRTPDGYSYFFNTIELSETLHGAGAYGKGPERATFDPSTHGFYSYDDIVVSAWYLDKMVSPLGEEVNYVYEVEDLPGVAGTKNSRYGSARISLTDFNSTPFEPYPDRDCYMTSLHTSVTKIFTNHIYLKEINHSLGKIVFNKSLRDDMIPSFLGLDNYSYLSTSPYYMTWINNQQGPQKLDNIIFQDNEGKTIKKFEFVYSYFNAQVTGNDKYSFKRLKLEKIRECSSQNCNPYYQLFYDETYPLPSKYSNAQDFWGYYNGAFDNPSRIPYGTYLNPTDNKHYFLGDADRQPNALYMTSGTMNKIIYPTGGSTSFVFEPHDYSVFGNDAYTLTDFNNNLPVVIGGLVTAEYDPDAFKTINFTITEAYQEISLSSTMTYYASATTSDPCNVTDPGSTYAGNEIWYSLQQTTTGSFVSSHQMSDFLTFFQNNYNSHCTAPATPDAIDPIYRKKESIVLAAGTYELKVYRRQGFNIVVDIAKTVIHPRTISQNLQGVYAKTAGGLRIKKIISKDNETANPLVKKYDYTFERSSSSPRTSTGRLMLYPNYHVLYYCTAVDQPLVAINGSSWSNTPIGTSASGSIVGYDQIIESDGDDYENGWTEYHYNNQEEEPVVYNVPLFITGIPTIKKTSNGLLKELKQFNRAGIPVKTEMTEYGVPQFPKQIQGVAVQLLVLLDPWHPAADPSFYCYDNLMVSEPYTIVSDRFVPTRKIERIYQDANNYLESITNYDFDTQTHLQLKSEQTTSSEGQILKITYLYPPEAPWIPTGMWQDKFIYSKAVQKEVTRNNNLINTYRASYGLNANTYLLNKEETASGTAPLETLNTYSYFNNGNIQGITNRTGITTNYIWDYKNTYPIAQVINGASTDIAYTSFEAEGNGNWTFSGAPTTDLSSLTGKKVYDPASGTITKTITTAGVYIISYWSKNGAKTITGTTFTAGRNANSWIYYEHKGSFAAAAVVTISGSGVIDELRLYPAAAQMTSYTYEPLIGQTSMSDANGQIVYYEYDTFNRLKNIKDYQGNIVKNFQYNYANSCGSNCVVLPMQTLTGSNTIGYPVGVFNVNGELLGNAANQADYILAWNNNAANLAKGVLAAGTDALHFNLTLVSGQTAPTAVTGLRYYQVDLDYTVFDAVRPVNGGVVEFGDGISLRLDNNFNPNNLPAYTTVNYFPGSPNSPYIIHSYPTNALKTITFYHNDDTEWVNFDNFNNPATCLGKLKNISGNFPQFVWKYGGSSFQEPTFLSFANVLNWNTITSLKRFSAGQGDGINPWRNLNFAQDFMQYNKGLAEIVTTGNGYSLSGIRDLTFKVSRLKSDWNTFFTELTTLNISEDHWNHEDISSLKKLSTVTLVATRQNHINDTSPPIPIDRSVIDNIIIQVAAGSGQFISNGTIRLITGGTNRSSASDTAYNYLISNGWAISISL